MARTARIESLTTLLDRQPIHAKIMRLAPEPSSIDGPPPKDRSAFESRRGHQAAVPQAPAHDCAGFHDAGRLGPHRHVFPGVPNVASRPDRAGPDFGTESGTYLGAGEWSATSDAGLLEPINPTEGSVLARWASSADD